MTTVFTASLLCAVDTHSADPFSFDFNGLSIYPGLNIEEVHNSNIYLQETNEVDSRITIIAPELGMRLLHGDDEYNLSYRVVSGIYEDTPVNDYVDHFVEGSAALVLNRRNRIGVDIGFEAGHEERGTGVNQGPEVDPDVEPVEFERPSVQLEYILGSNKSKGKLDLRLFAEQTEYQNSRESTRLRDREKLGGQIEYAWRIGSKTSWVFDLSRADIEYIETPTLVEDSRGTRDSSYYRYRTGLRWFATEITQTTIKVGKAEKDFESEMRDDFSGVNWAVDVMWAPKTYSRFKLLLERNAEESYERGDFVDEKQVSLLWRHHWTNQFFSRFAYSFSNDSYINHPVDREDDDTNARLALLYQFREWLECGISWDYKDRNSNLDGFSYNRHRVAVELTVGM